MFIIKMSLNRVTHSVFSQLNSLMEIFHLLKLLKLCLVFLIVSLTSTNALEPLYKAKGDDVVLDPNYPAPLIFSIAWKHGSDMAAEWFGNNITCFRQFKGRCSLDLSTGALTIRGLSGSDNGYYSAEINDKQIDSKTQLTVISKVSKPSIYQWCNSETTYCTLTCEGNTADAQPISYKWFADDVEGSSDNEIDIREDTKEESFYCMLLNPVSSERSESISNPIITFIRHQRNLMIAKVSAGVIVPILCCVAGFFIYKRGVQRYRRAEAKRRVTSVLARRLGRAEAERIILEYVQRYGPVEAGRRIEFYVQRYGPTRAGRYIEEEVQWNRRYKAVRRRRELVAPEVPEESNQGSASGVTQNNVGGSDSESQKVSTQVQVNNEPQNEGNSSEEVPLMAETSKQDPESAESPDTREETGNTPGTDETPNQDLTVPEPLNTSEETENSVLTSNNHEVTNHKSTNHQSTNPKPALVEEEADGGGDGD